MTIQQNVGRDMRGMETFLRPGQKAYRQAIFALFIGSFVTFALMYSTQPLIPLFSQHFHIAPAMASLTISAATAGLALSMIVVSSLSDARGRQQIMSAALIGTAGLAVLEAFLDNFYLLLVVRLLQGVLLSGFPAIAMAYIHEEFQPGSTGLVMGIYVSGTSIGGLLGRIIVSVLSDFFSWQIALGGLGVICLAAAGWFYVSLPASQHFVAHRPQLSYVLQGLRDNLRDGRQQALYSLGFLLMGSFVTLYNYIAYPLRAEPYSLSQSAVGCIFFVYVIGTFSSTFMGRLADRRERATVLLWAVLCMLGGAVVTLHTLLSIKLAGVALFTFGFFGGHAVASSWVGSASVTSKAQSASLYLLFYYIGSSVLGTAGGYFLSWQGWPGVVFLLSLAMLAAVLIIVFLLPHERDWFYHYRQMASKAQGIFSVFH